MCSFDGFLRGTQDSGGFVGVAAGGTITFTRCNATFTGIATGASTGGFIGWQSSGTVRLEYCVVSGTFTSQGSPAGVFIGAAASGNTVRFCENRLEQTNVACPFGSGSPATAEGNVNCPR